MNRPDDWQPGDLALCIAAQNPWFVFHPTVPGPQNGQLCEVRDVVINPADNVQHLSFVEYGPRDCFEAIRFRKIRPHTPDAEDAETIALLTGKPAQVSA